MTRTFRASQLVSLRGHDPPRTGLRPNPFPGVHIRGETWMPCVDEQDHRPFTRPSEIRLGQCVDFRRGGIASALPRCSFGGARVSVTRQVHQVAWLGRASLHSIDVNEPRLTGLGARTCQRSADQRVDQTRFAHVRPPHQGDLRQPVSRKIPRIRRTGDEFSGYLHRD